MAIIDDAFRVDALSIQDIVAIFQGSADPRTGVGQDAPVGSLFLESTTGKLYVKIGTGVFDWQSFVSGVGINANNASTGLLTGGVVSINADPTKINIAAGVGIVVNNHTDPINPTAQIVSWANITGVTVTNLATADRSSIGITSIGTVTQSPTSFSNSQLRDYVKLADLDHANRTSVSALRNTPNAAFDVGVRLHDLAHAIGPINVSGNVFTANGANLILNKSAGQTYIVGSNFQTDKSDPDTTLDGALVPVTFRYSYRDGSGGWITSSPVTTIDPNLWDDGSGTLQVVPNGRYSAQRVIYFGGANEVRVQYSQTTYSNIDAAHNNVIDPNYILNPDYYDGIIRAYVIVKSSTTDLTDPAASLIIAGSKFGTESGGIVTSTTTLQQAYLNSITPEITTITALGAVTIKEGSGVGGNLFEGYDSANNLVFSVGVNGSVTSGLVNGRDVATDGSTLDAHIADFNNPHQTSLLNLGDVAITTPVVGQVLSWNGTNWTNQTLPATLSDSGANGIVVRTALNTTTARTLTAPAAGLTITNPDGVSGNPTFALANDLAAIEALNGTGLYARTATDTWAARTITGTANTITVTNGAGTAGNPTVTIATNPVLPGTESVTLPSGSTAGRPTTPVAGMYRFNTTTLTSEVYNGSAWLSTSNQGTVTSVAANGGTTGLTFTGSPIVGAGTLTLSGTLTTANGGTGLSTIGTANQILGVNAGATGLEYKTITAGTGINLVDAANSVTISATNNGTVTSVGLSAPSIFTTSGSPVTSTGTLTLTLATQVKNTVFAGPAAGADATPTFRTLSLVNNDVSDVLITTPTNAQVLTYNSSTSKWINSTQTATSYSTVISAWTLASGNQYYADVVHNLGTFNVVISLFNATTNALIQANSIVLTNTNTARITVTGTPAYNIRCSIIANGTTIAAGGSTPSSVIVQSNGVPLTGTYTTLNVDGGLSVVNSGGGTATISTASSVPLRVLSYFATSLDSPNNADWVINALAPTVSDPTRPAMNVRQFSNTTEQGVGMYVPIPSGATSMTISYRGRTTTAPAAAAALQMKLYTRNIPNNAAVGSWTAGTNLTAVTVPTNAYVQYYTQTITLSSLALTAGNLYQFELTRNVGVAGNLAYNWLMNELTLSFT